MHPPKTAPAPRSPLHSLQSPFFDAQHKAPVPADRPAAMQRLGLAIAALLVGLGALVAARPAAAVEQAVTFGTPAVLSQQGQRLKVVVPVRAAANDRATAAAFLVRSANAAPGFAAPDVEGFTVMKPDASPYLILQSDEIVRTPRLTMMISVAGDPQSPYQMDLTIPPATATLAALAVGDGDPRRASKAAQRTGTRRILTPAGPADLPAK